MISARAVRRHPSGAVRRVLGRQLLVLALLLAPKAVPAAVLGPYTVYIDRFSQCNASESTGDMVGYVRTSKYDVQKQSILQRVTGNVTLRRFGITNSMWTRARLDNKLHAHWADNAYTFNFPDKTCSHGRTHMPGIWTVFFKQDLTPRPTCKVPPGTYTFTNEPVDWTFPKFPIMPFGSWTFHITMGENKTTLYCQNVDLRLVPKK